MAQSKDQEPNNDDQGAAFSAQQMSALGDMVNQAVSKHLTRKLSVHVKEAVAPMLEEFSSGLEERLGKRQAPDQQAQPQAQQSQANSKLEQDYQAMLVKVKHLESQAEQARITAQNQTRDGRLRELLSTSGVEPKLLNGALAVLRDGVKVTDSGDLVRRTRRDGYEEDIPLDQAVKEWTGTDEGRSYMAAKRTPQMPQRASAATVVNSPAVQRRSGQQASQVSRNERAQAALMDGIGALLSGGDTEV